MDTVSPQDVLAFLCQVTSFSSQIQQLCFNFGVLLQSRHRPSVRDLFTGISTAQQSLNQVRKLLDEEILARLKGDGSSLIKDDGLLYVRYLIEEFAAALGRIFEIANTDDDDELALRVVPKYWKSIVTTDTKGHKALTAPVLNETELFDKLRAMKWSRVERALDDVDDRLSDLIALTVLFIQVVASRVRLSSGSTDLQMLVNSYDLVKRTAKNIGLSNTKGELLCLKNDCINRRRPHSLSTSSSEDSYDDSDSDIPNRRMAPPSAPRWKGPPVPPPASFTRESTDSPQSKPYVYVERDPIILPSASALPPRHFQPPHTATVEDEINEDKPHPPSYTEKDRAASGSGLVSSLPSSKTEAEKMSESNYEKELVPESPKSSKESTNKEKMDLNTDLTTSILPVKEARLLKGSSNGLKMKFKSLFRSKSSLESEMKQTLAKDEASLSAFLINNHKSRKVPHSTFHSLEWTHMRTIISQLHDSEWFKVFSDLTYEEHDALESILSENTGYDKSVQRELVVLKVLQQNRFNAWVRLFEDVLRTDEEAFLPQHENFRIILVVVREKDSTGLKSNGNIPHPEIEPYDAPQSAPRPEFVDRGPRLSDLSMPPLPPLVPKVQSPNYAPYPRPQFRPNGPPPPAGWSRPPQAFNSHPPPPPQPRPQFNPTAQTMDVTPLNAISEGAALRALTSFVAYTFRPQPTQASPFPVESGGVWTHEKVTWARCIVQREAEATDVLLRRISEFHSRNDSIIDMKLQLTEQQASQIARTMDEAARSEPDPRFTHTLVELSMVDRHIGLVKSQRGDAHIDVIHIIIKRGLKERDGVKALDVYNEVMNNQRLPPPRMGPPPMPPMAYGPPRPEPRIVELSRKPIRMSSISSFTSRDSDSDSDTSRASTFLSSSTVSTYRLRRRARRSARKEGTYSSEESDDDDEEVEKRLPRWKARDDPSLIQFAKTMRGKDVVQGLLDRWTVSLNGDKKTEETKAEKAAKKKSLKGKGYRKSRRTRYYSDSLADD